MGLGRIGEAIIETCGCSRFSFQNPYSRIYRHNVVLETSDITYLSPRIHVQDKALGHLLHRKLNIDFLLFNDDIIFAFGGWTTDCGDKDIAEHVRAD